MKTTKEIFDTYAILNKWTEFEKELILDMTSHPFISRGQVWCRECGRTEKVNPTDCLRNGWPKCCGYTMTIDSPEEQKNFKNQ